MELWASHCPKFFICKMVKQWQLSGLVVSFVGSKSMHGVWFSTYCPGSIEYKINSLDFRRTFSYRWLNFPYGFTFRKLSPVYGVVQITSIPRSQAGERWLHLLWWRREGARSAVPPHTLFLLPPYSSSSGSGVVSGWRERCPWSCLAWHCHTICCHKENIPGSLVFARSGKKGRCSQYCLSSRQRRNFSGFRPTESQTLTSLPHFHTP